jgi:hypothetical protein
MTRTIVVLCALTVGLGGCADYYARLRAERAAEDDGKCQSYGAKPGDPGYVQCRAQLDAARTQASATSSAAAIQMSRPPPPIYVPPPPPIPCVGVCR